jgi:peptide chain release factor 1
VTDELDALRAKLADVPVLKQELEGQLSSQEVLKDPARLAELSRRYKDLCRMADLLARADQAAADLNAAQEMLQAADPSERSLARNELEAARERADAVARELELSLVPKDPHAGRGVVMEIRGAEGGEEANLFAKELYEMYLRYAQQRGWKVETLGLGLSDLGGVNEAILLIRGEDAWERLRFEGGPHRVQRVPVTESQGRVHTSAATVAVLPEAGELDVEIAPEDLRIDVYRSSGHGGQSVNTTDSAVRITHLPTGIVVTMQDERSQLQNRTRAMMVLRARLFAKAEEEQRSQADAERRQQVRGGGRSEKIRTYNFPQNRVTDHRAGITIHKLDKVMAGDLDEVIDALLEKEREEQLRGSLRAS